MYLFKRSVKTVLEVLEQFEVEIGLTPIYTQPSVSYGDLVTKVEPPDYVGGIQRPYFHAFFRYKFFFEHRRPAITIIPLPPIRFLC